jgi:hypothetical protein
VERSRSIGKSGLVILVGFENDGLRRSTRLLAGAHPRPLWVPQTGGGGADDGLLDLPAPANAKRVSVAASPTRERGDRQRLRTRSSGHLSPAPLRSPWLSPSRVSSTRHARAPSEMIRT